MSALSRLILIIVLCAISLLGSVPIHPTRAEVLADLVFYVNSFEDLPDYATNAACSAGSAYGGPCTLRAAVSEIEVNLPNHENIIINLPAGTYNLTIPPDSTNDVKSGDLNVLTASITSNVVRLIGTGTAPAVIDANQLDRVFDIGTGVKVVMENVVIRGGLLISTSDVFIGAGIRNYGDLELQRVVIENNELRCGQETCPDLVGGGLYNGGSMFVMDSTILRNTSDRAAALYNRGTSIIMNSTIADNYSRHGYVIMNYSRLTITNSTLSGNTTGGSIYWSGIYNSNSMSILLIESSTFANKGHYPSLHDVGGKVTIQDTIFFVEPGEYNCRLDILTMWESLGYNIFNDASCPATGDGDRINTDPKLSILGPWGGPTLTIALQPDSPALDNRDDICRVYDPLTWSDTELEEDQRHEPREDGQCDTGAFEGYIVLRKIYLPVTLK